MVRGKPILILFYLYVKTMVTVTVILRWTTLHHPTFATVYLPYSSHLPASRYPAIRTTKFNTISTLC